MRALFWFLVLVLSAPAVGGDFYPGGAGALGGPGGVFEACSTRVALGSSGTFTSPPCYQGDRARVSFSFVAEPSTASGTYFIDVGSDGVTWERTLRFVYPDPGADPPHALTPTEPYFRIRVENGSVAQTKMVFTTMGHASSGGGLVSRTDQTIGPTSDVDLVRVVNEPKLDATRGIVSTRRVVIRVARNAAIGSGAEEDIWVVGGDMPWLTSASAIRIQAGGDAADGASGSGARAILIECLGSDFLPFSEIIVTAGASASSATSGLCIRLQDAFVISVGVYDKGANVGDINIETTGGTVLARISAGIGVTQLSSYTIPADETCFLEHLHISVEANQTATFKAMVRFNADDVTTPFSPTITRRTFSALVGPTDIPIEYPFLLPAKTDVWARAQGGAAAAIGDVAYTLICIKDPL